jgi:hypothetical protein
MTTLSKSIKPKLSGKGAGKYSTVEEVSLAKNGDLIERFKSLNVKVVVKKNVEYKRE